MTDINYEYSKNDVLKLKRTLVLSQTRNIQQRNGGND